MKNASTSARSELPDLGSATATRRVIEVFERALQGKQDLQHKIQRYTAKSRPCVRDMLKLCFFRNELSLIDPVLPSGDLPAAIRLWKYWIDHPEELRRYTNLRDDILSYLISPSKFKEGEERSKVELLNLVAHDAITLLAFYPIVEELSEFRGRPASGRRPMAAKALQIKINANHKWQEITDEICDCGKNNHKDCVQPVRQSVIGLKRLLRNCGIDVPEPPSRLDRR